MTRTSPKSARYVTLVGLVGLLAGCAAAPMAPSPRASSMPAPVAPAILPNDVSGAAERACIAAGQERGLQVIGIAGSRDVVGPGGTPMRDVMLRVSRGGAQIEVRCNYQSDADLARIMLI